MTTTLPKTTTTNEQTKKYNIKLNQKHKDCVTVNLTMPHC